MRLIIQILCFIFLISCGKEHISNIQDYYSYLENVNNGLVKKRNVKGLNIKIKYLPADYMIYRDYKDSLNIIYEYGILRDEYEKNIYFLMTIEPEENNEKIDIMYKDIYNYKEYSERMYQMNFRMDKYVYINKGNKKLHPVIALFENVYGLKKSRDVLLIFNQKELTDETKEIDIVFEDYIFNTGINHFKFRQKDINNIPELELKNLKI